MKLAYVDTSGLVAIVLGQPGGRSFARRLDAFDEILSSNLLEAELRAALAREKVSAEPALLERITWILPDRPLSAEIRRVLGAGYARGADVWHLACALFLTEATDEIGFLTLDERQAELARALGFAT